MKWLQEDIWEKKNNNVLRKTQTLKELDNYCWFNYFFNSKTFTYKKHSATSITSLSKTHSLNINLNSGI